jgi:flagellar hook-length control protein FliK
MPSPAANTPADPTGATAPRIEAHTDAPHFDLALAPVVVDPTMTVQPARQAFATALAALSVPAKAPDDDGTDAPQAIPGFAAPTAGTLLQAAVQQVAAANQGALDPRHDRGLHGMIDHIEMLRDDANARDTRIRLTPDALGTVDVALRRDGDAVHVRFSSANEATRLVLNDAQPRLAALAEARGVRIAGSSIDSGADRGGNQPQPQPRTESPRPARTPRVAATTDTDTTDQRLA